MRKQKCAEEEAMTEDDCKLITEKLLGEKWHGFSKGVPGIFHECACGLQTATAKDMEDHIKKQNRTFTTPQDFMDCFEKLVGKGEWKEFYYKAMGAYKASFYLPWNLVDESEVSKWLLSRTESGHYMLCCLIAEALKEGGMK
jgi:hypothetical protein